MTEIIESTCPVYSQLSSTFYKRSCFLNKNKETMHITITLFKEKLKNKNISLLVQEFILSQLIFSYAHYGLAIFSPLGEMMWSSQLEQETNINKKIIHEWFEEIRTEMIESISILSGISEEPYWEELEEQLATSIIKRVICSKTSEHSLFCIDVFDTTLIESIDSWFQKEEIMQSKQVLQEEYEKEKKEHSGNQLVQFFLEFFYKVIDELQKEPLNILIWRISFLSVFDLPQENNFGLIIKDENSIPHQSIFKLIPLLFLFLPSNFRKKFKKDPPYSVKTLIKQIEKGADPALPIIRSWIVSNNQETEEEVKKLILLAINLKLLFVVKPKTKEAEYGLTKNALDILLPFMNEIENIILPISSETSKQRKNAA